MKFRVFSLLGIIALLVIAPAAFYSLSAQELWNSPSQDKKSEERSSYYNTPLGSSRSAKKPVKLYNSTNSGKSAFSYRQTDGLIERLEGLQRGVSIDMTIPPLFKYMDENAVENRMTDVKHALKLQEERRERLLPERKKQMIEADRARQKAAFEYAQLLKRHEEEKKAKKLAREQRYEQKFKMAMANGGEFSYNPETALDRVEEPRSYRAAIKDPSRTRAENADGSHNTSSTSYETRTRSTAIGAGNKIYNSAQ